MSKPNMSGCLSLCRTLLLLTMFMGISPVVAADNAELSKLEAAFGPQIQPLLKRYCHECHSDKRAEAEIDLSAHTTFAAVRREAEVWQKVSEMLDSGQMPPKDAKQATDAERKQLRDWVKSFLTIEAAARAGDPGPVVLRRLNNVEYTHTLRDLTGVATLDPAREFPVDGAAGEGFTNTGNALVMSPALVTKYLDAAKEVASHVVLLPDGIRFSPLTTRADRTNDLLARIREFYRGFSDAGGGDKVNLQGIVFDTNQGGRLPLERYLSVLLSERDALSSGKKSLAAVATEKNISPKYLGQLWMMLNAEPATPGQKSASHLLDDVRRHWKTAKPEDAGAIITEIAQWQRALWRFTSVGHIGKLNGPKAWQEPVNPLTARQELKLKVPAATGSNPNEVVLYLTAGDAGDGNEHDFAVWERPRFVAPGRPDLLLRDVRAVTRELGARREQIFASAAKCLAAAAEAATGQAAPELKELAKKHGVEAEPLAAWLDYLGIGTTGPVVLGKPITGKIESASGYDFVKGWVGDNALSVVANSSDQHVRIPGNMKPHGVAVHPTPTLSVAVGWRSVAAATLKVSGLVQHAHPECGNGVVWSVELRRGNTRQRLATGTSQGAKEIPLGPFEKIAVQKGDVISLVINPRDGNHSCDLTAIDLTLHDGTREWNLARDISPNILAGNPHADSHGNADVWHFYSEPASGATGHVIPAGSLLAKWQSVSTDAEKAKLADDLQRLVQTGPASLPKDSPDVALHQQLTSLGGPLLSAALAAISAKPVDGTGGGPASTQGLDPTTFGKHPNGSSLDGGSLCVKAPSVIEVRLPADLLTGAEFVTAGSLHNETAREGSVQMQVLTTKPEGAAGLKPTTVAETNANGPWTSNNRGVSHATPIIVTEGSDARRRFEAAFDSFRQLFPAALCYTKIVPVDEVVTLTLFYREDDQLKRLMLDDQQSAQLDRLWDEMHYISHDALTLVDAYEQLWQFATQDADPKVFEPLRKPIHDRAASFRKRLVETEPDHVTGVIRFAGQAYRRPLREQEAVELRSLYEKLRQQELSHDDAIRTMIARVLIAPAFLYRLEKPVAGKEQGPVSGYELASRLSYFLWSSHPDPELLELAAANKLNDPEVLSAQTKRMLRDPKARRLAVEFGCQWLHIHDFDHHDEKSEQTFPTFASLRGAMYEESVLFLMDLIQNNRSVLNVLDADYTFVNEDLAKHYGIPGVTGSEWRRVEGVKQHSRGGILTQATALAKQSGASRTSPILRGNWLSEVILGEKLPRPPKNVPQLSDTVPAGLTERQLIEKHSLDEGCAKCHARIDPFGFALENFDAIGRFRTKDAAGLPIDSKTSLQDGTKIDGLAGLRDHLLTARRDSFVRQFNRKLLGYALGRSVQLSDEPLLKEMQTTLQANDHRIQSAIDLIVRSRQFREIRSATNPE